MTIVTIRRFILDMSRVDCNLARLFFWRPINIFVGHALGPSLFGKDLGNGLRKGRLSVIHVTNGPNVNVRLVSLETLAGSKCAAGNHDESTIESSSRR